MRLPAMFVCLSVCLLARLLKNACMGLDEILCVNRCRESEHGRTDQLLSLIWIIVQMPESENRKIEDLSKSVKQARHSEQATGHVMHCREIPFTARNCSPRAREFPGRLLSQPYVGTVAELRGVKVAQFSDFGLLSPYETPKTYLPVTSL